MENHKKYKIKNLYDNKMDYSDNKDNEGEIAGLFYNMRDEDITLKAGEKMMQGVFVKYGITDDDNADGKRCGGFGSTGK